jgi:hypothetical protein
VDDRGVLVAPPVLHVLERVLSIRHVDELPSAILESISAEIRCDSAVFATIDPDGAPVQWTRPSTLTDPELMRAFEHHAEEFSLVAHSRTGSCAPVRRSDLVGDLAYRSSGIYAEFFRHISVQYTMAISIPIGQCRISPTSRWQQRPRSAWDSPPPPAMPRSGGTGRRPVRIGSVRARRWCWTWPSSA